MPRVTEIYRYPIKAHGVENLDTVTLQTGQTLPNDRKWAVAHTDWKGVDDRGWARCINFTRGAAHPSLMAVKSRLHSDAETITLSHPDRKDFTFQPNDERQLTGFLAWIKPLMDPARTVPSHIVGTSTQGMTDSSFPSISLNSHASLRALEERMGMDLSPLRFRGNIWFDDLPAWDEFNWIGKTARLGDAVLKVEEPIGRCKATMANPVNGKRDADTLGALERGWGHTDFGVFVTVVNGGKVSVGDTLELIV